ncbi:hypothetical protein JCM8097_000069 [Rhodosporidiobolus ruineniae]
MASLISQCLSLLSHPARDPPPSSPLSGSSNPTPLNSLDSSSEEAAGRAELVTGTKEGCIFCDVRVEKGFGVVYEGPEFVVFRDRSPGSKVHLLAVPRKHVDNVKTLVPEDRAMIERMKQVGRQVLVKVGVPEGEQRLGFHIPPFFSVNHLHLHLLSLPLPFPGSLKYRPAYGYGHHSFARGVRLPGSGERGEKLKGWGWFVEVDQVLDILQAGKRVKVGSVWSGAGAEAGERLV